MMDKKSKAAAGANVLVLPISHRATMMSPCSMTRLAVDYLVVPFNSIALSTNFLPYSDLCTVDIKELMLILSNLFIFLDFIDFSQDFDPSNISATYWTNFGCIKPFLQTLPTIDMLAIGGRLDVGFIIAYWTLLIEHLIPLEQ